ncbi:MAG TPA: hypothetical protein P5136_00185 [Methanofastidiosum sp.]|nr:hypothetical protein [Methanofastidiosum sp.]
MKNNKIILKEPCAKQTTIAFVISQEFGKIYVGSNWCKKPQKKCPRKDMKSGEGYEKCWEICEQYGHAEVDAVYNAGKDAEGAILILIGHNRICDDCREIMEEAGIKEFYIIDDLICKKNAN